MNSKQFGQLIRDRRKALGLKQSELALVAGTGLRFISDLENGKETCELGKALRVLENLGMDLDLAPRR